MSEMNDPKDLIEVLMRSLEQDAPDELRVELNERLRNDVGAREIVSRWLADEASLVLSLKADNIAGLIDDEARALSNIVLYPGAREPGSMDRPNRTASATALRWAVGIAAAFAVLASVLFMEMTKPEPAIMRVVELHGSLRWTGDGGRVVENLEEGQLLGGGTLETLTSESSASLVFLDGSRMTVSGLAMLTLSDFGQKELRLRGGNLSADVTRQPQGKPMLIHTPTAVAEVLGTRFNLSAEALNTQLTVNEGLVRMTRLADGSNLEVPADHSVVASLDQRDSFEATPRPLEVNTWHSALPWDEVYGEWISGENGEPGVLAAEPMLWKPKPDKKVVLQIAVLKVANGDSPPTVLAPGTQFRIRGRARTKGKIYFGFSTHQRNGGFAGKYSAPGEVITEPGEIFEIELPIEDFKPEQEKYPESHFGMELIKWWIVSFDGDSGLQIIDVELVEKKVGFL